MCCWWPSDVAGSRLLIRLVFYISLAPCRLLSTRRHPAGHSRTFSRLPVSTGFPHTMRRTWNWLCAKVFRSLLSTIVYVKLRSISAFPF